ncbi:acyl carrier protein [Nonomuraea sp. NN258]|uniref:phosphopantetheine-binding protein n=1 Tax=Nonomuraea antri TaxID=2730852 RepID=UPI0015683FFF|nr:phosphopantetheine-binding protein [Nonomuraea antri]NRQ32585.1 acyl carrier protein [Nonomuraea antri]
MTEQARHRLAELVAIASDGAVTADEVLGANVPLSALGVTSIAQMRLIDAVEIEYDVLIDLTGDDAALLDDLDKLAEYVTR